MAVLAVPASAHVGLRVLEALGYGERLKVDISKFEVTNQDGLTPGVRRCSRENMDSLP